MTEAVEILIKADDKASQKFAEVSANAGKASQKTGNAFKEMGGRAKATTEFVGTLASLTGNTELAGLASMIAGATEKASAFSEVAKAGGAGATAFKLGLMGLAATAGGLVGKAIGDMIWKTKEAEREMKAATDAAKELDTQLQKTFQNAFANRKEDIELIRDPEEKRAAHKKLFDDLNRDISTAIANVDKSRRAVEEWEDAWQITGERKAMAVEAQQQLEVDKQKLEMMKAQRQEVIKLMSARVQENEQIRLANAAKDRSESYLDNLRKEVEYMKATREEQIKLDALRNTTDEDRGEAERLLKERDAINAKAEAEKELAESRRKAQEEQVRAAEKVAQDLERARQKAQEDREKEAAKIAENAQREIQRIEDIKTAEAQRLELQRIELEQGKDAAKVQDLINQGVDKAAAQQLAAEEAAIEKLKQKKADEAEQGKTLNASTGGGPAPTLSASESRLLTRGPADQQSRWMEDAARSLRRIMETTTITADATAAANEKLGFIDENTSNTLQMVPIV